MEVGDESRPTRTEVLADDGAFRDVPPSNLPPLFALHGQIKQLLNDGRLRLSEPKPHLRYVPPNQVAKRNGLFEGPFVGAAVVGWGRGP
jgi:hypothetical protein